jgi:ferredoxin-thioredoxin reductase catalytic subunit
MEEEIMGVHCPCCGREVDIRQQKSCQFCGSELPPSLRLSESQMAYILNVNREKGDRQHALMEYGLPATGGDAVAA